MDAPRPADVAHHLRKRLRRQEVIDDVSGRNFQTAAAAPPVA
jgi:hypothetical protein